MKKQICLIALTTLLVSFVAISSVASAQTSNVQVVFFTSPGCSICQADHPIVVNEAAKYGVNLVIYDLSTASGQAVGAANGVSGGPVIVISGAQSTRLEGSVTAAQLDTAIQAAIGTTTVAKTVATPTPAPTVVKAVATATPAPTVVKAAVKPSATPKPVVVKAVATATPKATQPTIQVVQPTTVAKTSTQTVPEFSLLGLGAPTLIIGAMYLFLRRR